jgi:hypothetical protein
MQPRKMHNPPISSPPSKMTARKPAVAAVRAAAWPALPPPMIVTS